MKNWINNRKMSTKLFFILILAVLTIYISNVILIWNQAVTFKNIQHQLYDELYYSTQYLLSADRDLYQADQALMNLLMSDMMGVDRAGTHINDYENNLAQAKESVSLARDIIRADIEMDHTEKEVLIDEFFEQLDSWEQATRQLQSQTNYSVAQIQSTKEQFEQARNILNEIQADLELNAIHTIENEQDRNTNFIIFSSAFMFLSMITIFLLGFLLIRSITKPISRLVQNFEQIAAGDLQIDTEHEERHDEIGKLASSSKLMIEHLRNMVQNIQRISYTVRQQSEYLTKSANEVSAGAEQVAATMEQLSAGVEEQASSSVDMSTRIEDLNEQIIEADDDGKNLDEVSKVVYELSNKGKSEIIEAVEQMNEITSMVAESVAKINELEQRTEQISDLSNVIQEIAEQTNLLALNASIEAARAGEAGQGFAVVASEVRKLSVQVGESVNEITAIITGVQKETLNMVDSLQKSQQKVEDGNKQLRISQESFDAINEGISNMMKRIAHLTLNLSRISENTNQVKKSVDEIAAISEQSVAGIEQSSATAQQQSSSMQEIADHAKELYSLSEQLEETIKQFKV